MKSPTRRIAIVALLASSLLFASSCSGGKSAIVTPAPTVTQVSSVRQDATRVIDALTIALTIIDQAGATANSLTSLPDVTKNDIDCGIAKAVGLDAPSPAVITACGLVPTKARAPLRTVRDLLYKVTSRPSLETSIKTALDAARPLWVKLKASGNQALVSLGVILEIALQPAVLLGGVK